MLIAISPEAFDGTLMAWRREVHGGDPPAKVLQGVSIDGEALRGTRTIDETALMLISAFDHESACILLQCAVPRESNEQKTALELLQRMVLTGRVITAKENQPTLAAAISSEFAALDAPPVKLSNVSPERQNYTTHDKAHGRREKRTIESTVAFNHLLR